MSATRPDVYSHTNASRAILSLASFFALVALPAEAAVTTLRGAFTVEYYKASGHKKEMVDGREEYVGKVEKRKELSGPFELSSGEEMFQVRTLYVGEKSTVKSVVTSDYKSVFYSQIIEDSDKGPGEQASKETAAWARFDTGIMPNKLLGMEQGQILALSFLLATAHPLAAHAELPPELIPAVLTKQLKDNMESRAPVILRTTIQRSDATTTVHFWAVRKDVVLEHFAKGRDCGLLATLTVVSDGGKSLKAVVFERLHPFFSKAGFFGGEPHSRSRYEVTAVGESSASVLYELSYEPVTHVLVNDGRFAREGGYRLDPGQRPPFERTEGYHAAAKSMKERMDVAAVEAQKGRWVTALCVASIVPLWLALRARRNKETIAQIT